MIMIVMGEDGDPITLEVYETWNLEPDGTFWNLDKNELWLGTEKFKEWMAIRGNSSLQKKFMAKVYKWSRKQIENPVMKNLEDE